METRKYNTICSNCGAYRILEYTVDEGVPAHADHGRECITCKKLSVYISRPLKFYNWNMHGIFKRISALEARVKELEGNVRPGMPEETTDIPKKG